MGDLERAIARIQAACAGAIGRDSESVVLYEDAAKRRVVAFVAALNSLRTVQVLEPFWCMQVHQSLHMATIL